MNMNSNKIPLESLSTEAQHALHHWFIEICFRQFKFYIHFDKPPSSSQPSVKNVCNACALCGIPGISTLFNAHLQYAH